MLIRAIIPALNEEDSIGEVVTGIQPNVTEVVVVDNGSEDQTAARAKAAGATVLSEPERGYGNACLLGISYLALHPTDIVVFLDADGSDDPDQLPQVLDPILNKDFDLVVGSRIRGSLQKGSMTFPQKFGNKLAAFLMKVLYHAQYTDLGPFRAIRYDSLLQLNMRDRNYGWTVEMQLKAHKLGLKYAEVPVSYLKRKHGKSKVSGTLKGTVMAGFKIIRAIIKNS